MKTTVEHRRNLSFFPDGPLGGTMFSRYIAYHRQSGNNSLFHTKERLFGAPHAQGTELFGSLIHNVNRVLPPHVSLDVNRLMETATCFGIYSAALPTLRKAAWLEKLQSGLRIQSKKFVPNFCDRHYIKEHGHFCRECLAEDLSNFGIGHWRVSHQLNGVDHCPRHLTPLQGRCAHCGLSQCSEPRWNPPDIQCPHCGASAFVENTGEITPVYQRFLSLCESTINGGSNFLHPDVRSAIYRNWLAQQIPNTVASPTQSLIDQTLSAWGAQSLDDFGHRLSVDLNERFFRLAYSGDDAIVSPFSHLAILASIAESPCELENLRSLQASTDETSPLAISNQSSLTCSSNQVGSIDCLAQKFGLPVAVGHALAAGATPFAVKCEFGVRINRAVEFRRMLEEKGLATAHCKGRARGSSTPKNLKSFDATRTRHRRTIEDQISQGLTVRKQVREKKCSAVTWCKKHDSEWLDKVLPAAHRNVNPLVPADEKSVVYKSRIENYQRSNPKVTRTHLAKAMRTEFIWLQKHERAWIDEFIPACPRNVNPIVPADQKNAVYKVRLEHFVRSNPTALRTDVRNAMQTEFKWLKKHDSAWFEATMPRATQSGHKHKPNAKT